MGFLLGLEHASLTMMSSKTSKNGVSQASSRKSSLGVSAVDGTAPEKANACKQSQELGQNFHTNVTHNSSEVWMKEKEVTDIQCRLQPQFCDDCHDCSRSRDIEIRQRVKRTLSKFNAKWHSSEKLSLAKVNKTTSEVVTGLRYSVDFDAEEETSGRSCSSRAINSLGHRSSQDSSVINFNTAQRASI